MRIATGARAGFDRPFIAPKPNEGLWLSDQFAGSDRSKHPKSINERRGSWARSSLLNLSLWTA